MGQDNKYQKMKTMIGELKLENKKLKIENERLFYKMALE